MFAHFEDLVAPVINLLGKVAQLLGDTDDWEYRGYFLIYEKGNPEATLPSVILKLLSTALIRNVK